MARIRFVWKVRESIWTQNSDVEWWRKAHATSTNVAVSLQDQVGSERKISAAIRSNHADGVMALGPTSAEPALNAIRAAGQLGKVKVATFDLSPDVVSAIKQGSIEFAVDQQPFLEGYLSVLFLAQYQRYSVLPDKGRVVETGPSFVTPKNADVVSRLADQGIR